MRTLWLPWALCAASLLINAVLLLTRPSGAPPPSRTSPQPAATVAAPFTTIGKDEQGARSLAEEPAIAFPVHPQSTADRSLALQAYANMLSEYLETPTQLDEANRVVARWIAVDPDAASAWLNQRQGDRSFDVAVRAGVGHFLTAGDFDGAREWASSIQERGQREQAFAAILTESFRHGQIDAAAVKKSGLPEAAIRSILDGSALD